MFDKNFFFDGKSIRNEKDPVKDKNRSALRALVAHISLGPKKVFQPMNINFGLFPSLEGKVSRRLRGKAYTKRALTELKTSMVEVGLAGSGQELPS